MRNSLVVLLLGLSLAGCGSGEDGDVPPSVTGTASETSVPQGDIVTVTEADSGGERTLRVGQRLTVRLASNPSTGYGWQLTALDQNVVRPLGEREYVSDQPVMPGTPGTELWTFAADAAGVTRLTMEYRRPWEPGADPARTFSLALVVQG
ncbi:protease inhibitor I42 family protein [Nocardia sp. NPDC127579]|uniref:protease inhibitor I42 family protein n=1 Tax=Nocardia sp. NPDC127579 TaxID=3345402 RepID=UPI0036271CAA